MKEFKIKLTFTSKISLYQLSTLLSIFFVSGIFIPSVSNAQHTLELNDGTIIHPEHVESQDPENYKIVDKSTEIIIPKKRVKVWTYKTEETETNPQGESNEPPQGAFARSDREESEDASETRKSTTITRISIGTTSSAETTIKTKNNSGSVIDTSNSEGKGGLSLGIEVEKTKPESPFSYGFEVLYNKYDYDDGTEPDSHLSFLVTPKIRLGGGPIKAWFSGGAGLSLLTLGTPSQSVSGYNFSFEPVPYSISFYPKFAIEGLVSPGISLNAHIGFFMTSPTLSGTVSSGSSSAKFEMELSRSWTDIGASIVFEL